MKVMLEKHVPNIQYIITHTYYIYKYILYIYIYNISNIYIFCILYTILYNNNPTWQPWHTLILKHSNVKISHPIVFFPFLNAHEFYLPLPPEYLEGTRIFSPSAETCLFMILLVFFRILWMRSSPGALRDGGDRGSPRKFSGRYGRWPKDMSI